MFRSPLLTHGVSPGDAAIGVARSHVHKAAAVTVASTRQLVDHLFFSLWPLRSPMYLPAERLSVALKRQIALRKAETKGFGVVDACPVVL
jgi:hypothetical protein